MGPRRSALFCFVLLCALTLCCATPALALQPAGDGWFWVSPQPQGQMLNEVTFGDAVNVWAVGDAGTILHSADAGLTWSRQSAPTTEPLCAVVFTDALHGWAAGGLGWNDEEPTSEFSGVILATQDGGATWVVQQDLRSSAVSDLAFVSPLEGWAVGSHGLLLHTTDGGATWLPQDTGVRRNLMSVAFEDARRGYIGAPRGLIIRTSDGGATWTRERKADYGMWSEVSSLVVGDDHAVWAGLGGRGEYSSFGRLARSADRGRTWRVVKGLGATYAVSGLAVDGDRTLAVGPLQEAISSAQRNAVSRVLSIGADGRGAESHIIGSAAWLGSVASNGEGLLCAVGDAIVTSSDGGETWYARSTHLLSVDDLDMVGATDGWATGGSSSLSEALYEDDHPVRGSVFHSSDGVRWDERLSDAGSYHGVDFADAANGWAVGDDGVIKHTTDGGGTWTDQSVTVQGGLWYVFAASATEAWAGGSETGPADEFATVLLRTTDAGETWSRVTLPDDYYSFAMDFRDAKEGWVSGALVDEAAQSITPVILHTGDGGATWAAQSLGTLLPGNTLPIAVEFADAEHGWVSAIDYSRFDVYLVKTSDGGDTWQQVSGGSLFENDFMLAMDFVSPLEGWASGAGLYHTTDGGATWERQVQGLSGGLLAISAADPTHIWAGGAGLLGTVDGAGDSAPPATLSDVEGGWTRSPVAIHLTAADIGGSGLASTEYRVDDGAWTPGLVPPAFLAPADHSGDGMHIVEYRSADAAGNIEPIQSVGVYVDTIRPVVRLGRAVVGRDRVLRMRMRLDDASCPSVERIRMKFRDAKGLLWMTSWRYGDELPTNEWFTYREKGWRHLRGGRYTVEVRVWDRAGTPPLRDGKTMLTVARRGKGEGAGLGAQAPTVVWRSAPGGSSGLPFDVGERMTSLLRRLGRVD